MAFFQPIRAALAAFASVAGIISVTCAAAPVWAQKPATSASAQYKQAVTQADGITSRVVDNVWEATDEYWHHGDYNRIVGLIRLIVEADPTFYEAYSNGAWLIWSMGDIQGANDFLLYGIDRAPEKWALQYEFGWHLHRLKRHKEALPYLQKAVAYPKGAPWSVWHVLAHCYEKAGQPQKSLATWETIVKKFPDDAVAKPNLARMRAKYGKA